MPFIPHNQSDIRAMLAAIGVSDTESLFNEIPAHLQVKQLPEVPQGMTEAQIARFLQDLADKDKYRLCFNGAGAYEHHIPAAVWDITSRGEFMTAYTPYQAEASQGTLQLIYEYQSMMAELMAADVSNASLYDGASALAEAVLMAARIQRKHTQPKVLMLGTVNPTYQQVVDSIVRQQNITIEIVPLSKDKGYIEPEALAPYAQQEITAIVIAQPNFLGQLEQVDALTRWAHAKGSLVIAAVNPIAMALVTPPGRWGDNGADIICGEGQPLGVPLASGGPYFGFMCCKMDYVRQMPGRIVGKTTDQHGREGFALTLQAREQHIRRSKATSNICTNQGLAVTAATIYMSMMGYEGLRRVALKSHQNMMLLLSLLQEKLNLSAYFKANYFHETVLHLPVNVSKVRELMAERGIEAGIDVSNDYPLLVNGLLVCTTETKTPEDLICYVDNLAEVITQLTTNKTEQKSGSVIC